MAIGICNTIADYSAQGAMPLFFSIRDCIPGAFEAVLFFVFILIFAGNYFIMKKKTGRARVLVALLASSFSLVPLSMLLALATLVTYGAVVWWAFFSIVIFILFLVSDKK